MRALIKNNKSLEKAPNTIIQLEGAAKLTILI